MNAVPTGHRLGRRAAGWPSPRLGIALALALLSGVLVAVAPRASAQPIQYVTMDDGVKIAVSIHYPKNYRKGGHYPSVLEMSGYDGAAAADDQSYAGDLEDMAGLPHDPVVGDLTSMLDSHYFTDDGYVVVQASIRGTGCSGGEFDLYSQRSARDGREVIEWMARQPWSNGKVGLNGHSYSGATGFMIAATHPPHLVAATLSGLVDDVYRGITYPGGVPNYGFPLIWASGYRLALDLAGGVAQPIARDHDTTCAVRQTEKRREIADDPLLNGSADVDGPWYREHSLYPLAHRIDVPTWIWAGSADEQTGPRGNIHLWDLLRGVPKRLLMGNSDHDGWWHTPVVGRDRVRWMNHWMGRADEGFGTRRQARTSTETLFEIHDNGEGALVPTAIKRSRTFPLEDTRWTKFYFRAGGRLAGARPDAGEGADTYLSGTERYSWSYQAGPRAGAPVETAKGPDEVVYTSRPVRRTMAISGPLTADLWLSSTDVDTDMFVQLVDVAPDGSRSYLQRGVLKSSMRAIDKKRSERTPSGRLYRPWYADTDHDYVTPGSTAHYLVEIWPVAWLFRPGHRIAVEVHAPPLIDSFYAYMPKNRALALTTVAHDRAHPSRITLPVVPIRGMRIGRPLACGDQFMVRCLAG